MSLSFDFTNIKDHDSRRDIGWIDNGSGGKTVAPKSHAIVFSCIATGIGEITERTAPEFWARVCLYQKIEGPLLTDGEGKDRPFEKQDIYDHIGLVTNVFPEETRTKWMGRIIKARLEQEKSAFQRFVERQEATA